MTRQIRAVLFDCDGVLQRPANDWTADLAALTGLGPEDGGRFGDALHAADLAALDGSTTFGEGLVPVVSAWGLDVEVADLVAVFQRISVDDAMLDAVRGLLAAGIACGLGTNQHPERAAFMRRELGFEALFDPIVISSEIGWAKPHVEFFAYAADAFGLEPGEILFTDDVVANVEGARQAGLVAEHFSPGAGRPELDRILALHGLADLVPA